MTAASPYREPINLRDLPPSWTTAPLQQIALQVISGKSSGRHTSEPPGLIHLRPMNVSRDGLLDLSDLRFIQESYPNEFPRLSSGDILFNNTNSAALVGKTALMNVEHEYSFSNHMTAIRLPKTLSAQFFALQLHYFWMTGFYRTVMTQHINQASVGKRALLQQVTLAIPPTKEQHRIARKLESLFKRISQSIELLQNALENIDTLTSSFIRLSVTDRYRHFQPHNEPSPDLKRITASLSQPRSTLQQVEQLDLLSPDFLPRPAEHPSHENEGNQPPFPLPQGWSWSLVNDVGEVRLGRQRSPKHHTGPNMRPYLRVANVFENRIDLSDIKKMNFSPEEFDVFQLRYGDILLNEGQSLELVGRPTMYRGEIDNVCFQNTLIRFRASEDVDPEFALLVFRHYFRSGQFQRIARWSTNIAHLGLKRFSSIPFPLPPLAEQRSIAHEANIRLLSLAKQHELVSSLIDRANSLRQSLLAEAFAGRLVSQRPEEGTGKETLAHVQDAQALVSRSETAKATAPKQRTRTTKMRKPRPRSIPEIIREAGGSIATYELFERCGFSVDTVDEFYEHLKVQLNQGRIRQSVSHGAPDSVEPTTTYIELL